MHICDKRYTAIEEAFKEHATYIFTYAVKLTGSIKEAEDLTQDTYLTAYEKYHQLRDVARIKYWLRRICLNKYLKKLKKTRNHELYLDSEGHRHYENIASLIKAASLPSIEDEIIVDESISNIRTVCFMTVVHRMKLTQRIVFLMVEIFGLSTQQVSEILGMSNPAVKSQLIRYITDDKRCLTIENKEESISKLKSLFENMSE